MRCLERKFLLIRNIENLQHRLLNKIHKYIRYQNKISKRGCGKIILGNNLKRVFLLNGDGECKGYRIVKSRRRLKRNSIIKLYWSLRNSNNHRLRLKMVKYHQLKWRGISTLWNLHLLCNIYNHKKKNKRAEWKPSTIKIQLYRGKTKWVYQVRKQKIYLLTGKI